MLGSMDAPLKIYALLASVKLSKTWNNLVANLNTGLRESIKLAQFHIQYHLNSPTDHNWITVKFYYSLIGLTVRILSVCFYWLT